MALKTTRWDASEFLDSDESIAAYLNAAFEEGDPGLIAASIGHVAKAKGMSQIARETGLSRENLYRALGDGGNPELSTMTKVMRALGMRIQIAPAKPTRRKRVAA
ncbi:MAG TPA: addiction module antidote protein [Xanthobacteraceae bacterium]|nr:addiction module antidote protein [Xanthobacteraceae bacterium]